MSFLQRARDKAAVVAKEAAEATSRAAESVGAKAHDPATQARVRAGMAAAGHSAGEASKAAAGATSRAATAAVHKAQDPETQKRVKEQMKSAGRSARTIIERIDPGILADVIIKTTALQEKANARLQAKGSIYRIGEIQVTASLPPGVSFSIVRIGDAEARQEDLHSSLELIAEAAQKTEEGTPTLTLAGGEEAEVEHEEYQEAAAESLAEFEAAIVATEAALDDAAAEAEAPGEVDVERPAATDAAASAGAGAAERTRGTE